MKLEKDNTQETCLEDEDFVLAVMGQEDSWIRAKLLANYYEDLFEGDAQEEAWVPVKQTHSQRFAQEAESKKDTGKTIELPKEYQQFASVFGKQESTRLPTHRPWDLEIKLKPDYKPYAVDQAYEIPPNIEPYFNKWLNENLEKGYIRPSKSEHAAGLFFVGKWEGKEPCPCMDYQILNSGTVRDVYPLPLVSDLMLRLQGNKFFTKLDLHWGYNNICMKPGSEKFAAFKTPRGLFEPLVMFFGLCNSPAAFQRMMNEYFRDMINEKWIVIYMDDILIMAKTPKELEERTKRVLQRLKDKDLFLKLEKCKFNQTELEYLGLIISEGQIRMDAAKLAGIKQWPEPTTVKQVRSFLGFANFYCKFIGHYSELAKPLNSLTKKDIKFEWTEECQKAFDTLKEKFLEEPVLKMIDTTKQFVLETDASKWATGAVLKQLGEDRELHPCGYISKTLTTTERNYQIYDRELLAVIHALETWRHALLGSPHPVIVHCDHRNLGFYKKANKVSPRQAQWLSFLQQFNLLWQYVPGSKLIQADALSRRHDHIGDDTENDEEYYILIPPDKIISVIDSDVTDLLITLELNLINTELAEEIKTKTVQDRFATSIHQSLKQGTTPIKSKLSDWNEEDGVYRYQGKIYVPEHADLHHSIIKLYHDKPHAGHPGRFKTMELVKREYWWPGMNNTIKKWIEGCATCQQMKVNTHPTKPRIQPIKSNTTRPFQQVTCDFITDLPPSNGFDSIMVVVDHGLSKGVIYTPCTKNIDALGTAQIFIDQVWRRFGLPDIIISDRGPQFSAKVFQEMMKGLEINHRMSTAYHPQTDGETERVNQELETYLRIFCTNNQRCWSSYLPMAEFAHNNRIHEATKLTPFQVMYGTDPKGIPTAFPRMTAPA